MSINDTDRLEFLESLLGYTGSCILQEDPSGRGWKLCESARPDAMGSVREAIDDALVAGYPAPALLEEL